MIGYLTAQNNYGNTSMACMDLARDRHHDCTWPQCTCGCHTSLYRGGGPTTKRREMTENKPLVMAANATSNEQ